MASRAFWKSFRIFAPLPPEALDAVAAAAHRRTWTAGEMVFQRGDPGDWLVGIESGRVRVVLTTSSGRELVLRQAAEGEILGELALFDEESRSADATASEPTVGYVLTRADFRQIAAQHPALNEAALAYLSSMLRDTTGLLESIALYQLRARVARFFLFFLTQLNGKDIPEGAAIRLSISQGELATMLGASRPKVNRILQEFREEGILGDEGAGVWRCNVAALRAEASTDE